MTPPHSWQLMVRWLLHMADRWWSDDSSTLLTGDSLTTPPHCWQVIVWQLLHMADRWGIDFTGQVVPMSWTVTAVKKYEVGPPVCLQLVCLSVLFLHVSVDLHQLLLPHREWVTIVCNDPTLHSGAGNWSGSRVEQAGFTCSPASSLTGAASWHPVH